MTLIEVLEKIGIPLIAAFIGAVCAFTYNIRLQKHNDKKLVLATLMAFRFAGVYEVEFVKALNMVDIVFYDNKKVRELLHKYYTYYSNSIYSGGHRVDTIFEMMFEMGKDIGYKELKQSDIKDFFTVSIRANDLPTEGKEP